MTAFDLYLQQAINGLSLGAMYSLLMVGAMVAMLVLQAMGISGQSTILTGIPLVATLLVAFVATMCFCGVLGMSIERFLLRPLRAVKGPAAMILTIGVSYVLFNVVLLTLGTDSKNFPNPLPPITWEIGGAVLRLREVLIWVVAILLMGGLTWFVQRSKLGKAMRATAQDPNAARMMGVEVDRVVMSAFFIGSALAGASGMIFGLYYNLAKVDIGFSAGLRAFTAAVLGGIGNVPGAMVGGVLIGLIEAGSGQMIGTAWSDVVIFSLLVLVLVFKPAGLMGRLAPNKS
jgi:branched-chain amino acid transport system permease protein